MSSMAAYAIEMGMDPCVGPDGREWSDSIYRRPDMNREVFGDDSPSDRIGYDTPLGFGRSISSESPKDQSYDSNVKWFSTAQDANQLARANPGSVVRRAPDGNGFNVILKHSGRSM